ncbi:hypothetical protein WME76_37995 [Sorangium sp. So ce119]|uniref:hypothetical protein n=1 Tax=Sorangium sp. So ce119 TaxID=3133279 RepID=UPI003F6041B2
MSTPRWLRAFALAASAAASFLAAAPAAHAWHPPVHRSDAGVDLYMWSARYYGTSLATVPFVQFEPTPDLFINLQFPVALSIDSRRGGVDLRSESRAGLGNPTFALYYSDIDGKLTWYAGGRISLPLNAVDDVDWRWATSSAGWAMALYDAHLWATDTLPIGGFGGIEYRFGRPFVLRAGGDLTFMPPLSDRVRNIGYLGSNDLDVVFQTKVEPEFQSRAGFGGGVSLRMVWVPTAPDVVDDAQVSLMPYFVYDSQKTFFMRAGLLLALDEPAGPAFDTGQVASLYLQFGGHLD